MRLRIGAREYTPGVIAVDRDDTDRVIEVELDKEPASADVRGKREAARHGTAYVGADATVATTRRSLLASEAGVKTAAGSWQALKGPGGRRARVRGEGVADPARGGDARPYRPALP